MNKPKPIFRWAGSKKALLPILVGYVPPKFTRYVEPFCGSARLFFELSPKDALLSDINEDLINTYCQLQKYPGFIYDFWERSCKDEREYYTIRQEFNTTKTTRKKAALFYYLNRLCFNGVYRTNKSGKFNVPRGRGMGPGPNRADFLRSSHSLGNVEFQSDDFWNTVMKCKGGDFVYLDPPYLNSRHSKNFEYGPKSFESDSLKRLRNALDHLDRVGAKFLLSYRMSESKWLNSSNWYYDKVAVRRSVSGFVKGRGNAKEMLIMNYKV